MWICAGCGTEAQQPDMCSGCGSRMKPFGEPPKEDRYQFVLIAYPLDYPKLGTSLGVFGPFASVLAADLWWETFTASRTDYGWKDYEVVLMENPND